MIFIIIIIVWDFNGGRTGMFLSISLCQHHNYRNSPPKNVYDIFLLNMKENILKNAGIQTV